ncbi:MAG: glycoside hydrolase family 3 C-terminal domain-containing protein [Candidatus Korobacteraceae bacterium]
MHKKRLLALILLASAASGICSTVCIAQPASEIRENQSAHQRADALLKQMTLDEKLQLIVSRYPNNASPGGGGGYVEGIPRLNIPAINISDSGTGSGSNKQRSSTFPATIAVAASWDRQLSFDYAVQIARELRAQGFGMGLGGGTNLAREPRCGRIFEYLGEDPVLSGELLAQRTLGTQSQHVIASIKHFAGNEQETNRMGGNSTIDERTLRELYLLPFEIAIEKGHPGSVMCSYNRLNGDYACETTYLLTDILKNDWQFQGFVQSDWGATHSTARAINAGLDEEEGSEPGATWFNRIDVLYALANHDITEARLDDMVRRKLYAMITTGLMDNSPNGGEKIDFAAATAFAQSAEEQSIVLLKNDGAQLPLSADRLKNIAVIGSHADIAVGTGGGSGDTMDPVTGFLPDCGGLRFGTHAGCDWWRTPWLKLDVSIVRALQEQAPNAKVTFAGNREQVEPFRAYSKPEIDKAVALAAKSDVAVVIVNQPAGEDFGDLPSLSLANPANQDALVQAVAAVNAHTIVILENGNPVLMPWRNKVAAIVEAWFPGQGGGRAIANVLFGKVNPSGKLPMTFPERNEDIPTWGKDGTMAKDPVYTEKLNIGYRWYDAKKIKPMFEFGYGLSYTHFGYSNLSVNTAVDNTLTVVFTVKNEGSLEGAEVPQVYLGINDKDEPPLRLVGFSKINVKPGESRQVRITISPRMQSIWSVDANDWKFIPDSRVYVGASSRDIRLSKN